MPVENRLHSPTGFASGPGRIAVDAVGIERPREVADGARVNATCPSPQRSRQAE